MKICGVSEPLSGKSSPSSSDDEGDEKKDSEKESPVVSAPSPKPEMEVIGPLTRALNYLLTIL